jgi:hypothetical protein
MIFDAMNQGQLQPGRSLTNPICPFSTLSQAAYQSSCPCVLSNSPMRA